MPTTRSISQGALFFSFTLPFFSIFISSAACDASSVSARELTRFRSSDAMSSRSDFCRRTCSSSLRAVRSDAIFLDALALASATLWHRGICGVQASTDALRRSASPVAHGGPMGDDRRPDGAPRNWTSCASASCARSASGGV